MEVNVYNVSNYGYCEVDRFGWGYISRAGVDSGYMDSWLCLCVYVSGYFHWECLDAGILFSLRWG